MAWKSSSARFKPSSVNTTDLAVHRVVDQVLLVEPVQRIPIKPLPGPPVVVKGQKEERQHRFVDLVRVERHPATLPVSFGLRWGSWPHAYPVSEGTEGV